LGNRDCHRSSGSRKWESPEFVQIMLIGPPCVRLLTRMMPADVLQVQYF
jgi:hypothetical protein